MAFDPDQYLASKTPKSGFDPDAYLASKSTAQEQPSQEPQKLDGLLGWNRRMGQTIANVGAGAIRGAGSIGATLLRPFESADENEARRLAMDEGLRDLGADPESMAYGAGKLGGEIAGTAGIGGVLARGVMAGSKVAPTLAPKLASAIQSGGLSLNAPGASALSSQGVGNAATRIAGGAIAGGSMAGAINPEDVGTGAVLGGALPAVVKGAGMVGSKIAQKMQVSPEVAQLAQKAKSLGIDIPADRLADSKILNAGAASLDYVPFSGRIATETKMNNQIKKALSKTFGENTDNLSKDLFAKTQQKLGKGFDDFLTKNKVNVDQQLYDDMQGSLTKAKNELSADNYRIIENQVKDLWGKIDNGIIDGNAAYNVKKTLDRLGRGNGNEAYHAREVRNALMDALKRSVSPDKAMEFTDLQRKYSNLKSLQKLASNSAEGEISMARLGNIDSPNPEVSDLAKIAATFAKGRESPHGAMQRVTIGSGIAALGGGALAGLAVPVAAGLTVGRGANMALNSNALRNVMLGQQATTNSLADLLANPATRAAISAAQSR